MRVVALEDHDVTQNRDPGNQPDIPPGSFHNQFEKDLYSALSAAKGPECLPGLIAAVSITKVANASKPISTPWGEELKYATNSTRISGRKISFWIVTDHVFIRFKGISIKNVFDSWKKGELADFLHRQVMGASADEVIGAVRRETTRYAEIHADLVDLSRSLRNSKPAS